MFDHTNVILHRGQGITLGMKVRRVLRKEGSEGMRLQTMLYPRTAKEMPKHEYSPLEREQDRWSLDFYILVCGANAAYPYLLVLFGQSGVGELREKPGA